MKKITLTIGLCLLAITGFAKDIKTVVVTTTPQMHCEKCENRVKQGLIKVNGVQGITTSLVAQTVTVKYDADKISEENLIKSFATFNYEARKLKEGEKVVREKHECKEEENKVVYETE
ncbi:MAG: heavy-metal-associated domain-containing protein [Bacteroidaceae bacterium]|nr:heavy-metal-associated domain-containing protein [Bacteroidaceae bacterium]